MTAIKILLLLLICSTCHGKDIFIRIDKQIFRICNIHMFDMAKLHSKQEKLYVSKYRDLFLEPVKYTVKSVIDGKTPSNLHIGAKIELKSDGKILTGKIINLNEYFIQSDIPVMRGDSGKSVTADAKVIGLISYSKNKTSFIVRIDTLSPDEFEKITPYQLLKDWKLFNDQKEYEYAFIDGLKNCTSRREMKRFLKNNLLSERTNHKWHSSYLEAKFRESAENIRNLVNILSQK